MKTTSPGACHPKLKVLETIITTNNAADQLERFIMPDLRPQFTLVDESSWPHPVCGPYDALKFVADRGTRLAVPGATAKDKEKRRIPFNPEGRLAAILKRRAKLGPDAYVFESATGAYWR